MEPTEYLRLVERGGTDKHPRFYTVLQQWWQSEEMIVKGEWRDVPTLPEDDTPPVSSIFEE